MPTANGNTNRYTIKNISPTANITISTTYSQTIDGATTAVIPPYTSVDLVSDNANWWVV
jgi:hypothetical protein